MVQEKNARDPERRQRIIDSTLATIVDVGVAGISHRKIAARAEVPLGSMTYYFTGIDQLLREAFDQFVDERIAEFQDVMSGVQGRQDFREQYISYVSEVLLDPGRNLILTLELYTLAGRQSSYRALTKRWMAATRDVLSRHVDPETAVLLDGLIEGFSLHRALGSTGSSRELVARGFDLIVHPSSAPLGNETN